MRLNLTAVFTLVAIALSAQQPETHTQNPDYAVHYCDIHGAYERLIQEHPEMEAEILERTANLERETEEFIEAGLHNLRNDYIIPVVFHIIHANGAENISDAQVFDAIRVLNEDFNLGNVDVSAVIPEFQGIVANVGVEFRLARLDPNGQCTKGIVRTFSSATYQGGENLKSISPTWPRNRYLNVRVAADLSSGAAGYTYTPGSVSGFFGASADGIVIKHTYVGSIGTGNYLRSRALTHEVGHWINLHHPWGSTNNPGLESNCNSDDNVADTPNTIGWTACSLSGVSCGSLDNVQNFMEYSYCSRMFTNGQKARMLAALNSTTAQRNQLWSANTHQLTGVLGDGILCQVELQSNMREICAGGSVIFTDNSFHNITGRQWTFEGGFPQTSSEQQVEVVYNEPGIYNVNIQITSGLQTITESLPQYIRVWPNVGAMIPFMDDFEWGWNLEDHWTIVNPDGGIGFEMTNLTSVSGNQSMRLNNRYNTTGAIDEILSRTYDLTDTSANMALSFKYAFAKRNPSNNDKLSVWISNDCGETWSIRALLSANIETAPYNGGDWVPSSESHWQQVVIDNITESHYVSNFRFKFRFEAGGGNNLYIDDINIGDEMALSVENMVAADEISVFPNPAKDQTQLLINSGLPFRYDLTLYNAIGQVVYSSGIRQFAGGSEQVQINTGNLDAGLYLVHIQPHGQSPIVKRLVISK